jgi:hypothetical protein
MNFKGNCKWFVGLAVLALAIVNVAPALPAQQLQQETGQPARAARLSYIDGQVRLSQAGQVLAEQVTANTPLMEGMNLVTADNGKAEIQFEDGSLARLAPDSSLTIKVLRGSGSSAAAELELDSGLAYFEIQGGDQAGPIKVRFGNDLASVSGFTVFRVDRDNPPGQLAVFSGNLHLEGGLSVDLHSGENLTLNASDPSQYNLAESIEPDSWDSWNSDRDQALTAESVNQTGVAADYGETENPAWSDLDSNGNWYNVPGQGYVWSPYAASSADFDPYGSGNWVWIPGYGYTWVSGYSWGYLPFSCGNWNWFNGFGWGWAPGMGGCRRWWSVGFYGGPNYGNVPITYHRIPRPGLPHRPVGGGPIPVVAINRHEIIANSVLPQRDKISTVNIGGNYLSAEGNRPPNHRDHGPSSGAIQIQFGSHDPHGTAGQGQNQRPSYGPPPSNNSVPAQGFHGQNQSQPSHGTATPQWTPPSNPPNTNNGSANRPSNSGNQNNGSARPSNSGSGNSGNPHPSGGNSGGGGSHPSGGSGGSGGGGGSHPSGGGGGGSNSSSGSGNSSTHH